MFGNPNYYIFFYNCFGLKHIIIGMKIISLITMKKYNYFIEYLAYITNK